MKEDEIGVVCSAHRNMKTEYKILFAEPEEKIPLGRPRRRWENNIKMDHRIVGCGLEKSGS
jgi:hypothetical protein